MLSNAKHPCIRKTRQNAEIASGSLRLLRMTNFGFFNKLLAAESNLP